mmetsp:Transcript_73749/g.207090  ORF Transcript_73749/g.207090 Transcript_73749/m.207090 type:complete len:288 (+) Transcript_73749:653-1516(+)
MDHAELLHCIDAAQQVRHERQALAQRQQGPVRVVAHPVLDQLLQRHISSRLGQLIGQIGANIVLKQGRRATGGSQQPSGVQIANGLWGHRTPHREGHLRLVAEAITCSPLAVDVWHAMPHDRLRPVPPDLHTVRREVLHPVPEQYDAALALAGFHGRLRPRRLRGRLCMVALRPLHHRRGRRWGLRRGSGVPIGPQGTAARPNVLDGRRLEHPVLAHELGSVRLGTAVAAFGPVPPVVRIAQDGPHLPLLRLRIPILVDGPVAVHEAVPPPRRDPLLSLVELAGPQG